MSSLGQLGLGYILTSVGYIGRPCQRKQTLIKRKRDIADVNLSRVTYSIHVKEKLSIHLVYFLVLTYFINMT